MIMIMIMILYIYQIRNFFLKVLRIVCDCTVLHKTLDSFGNCLKKNVEIIRTIDYLYIYKELAPFLIYLKGQFYKICTYYNKYKK